MTKPNSQDLAARFVRVGDRISTTAGMREVLSIDVNWEGSRFELTVQDPSTVSGRTPILYEGDYRLTVDTSARRVSPKAQHAPGRSWKSYPRSTSVPYYDVCPGVVSDYPTGATNHVDAPCPDDMVLILAAPDLLAACACETCGGNGYVRQFAHPNTHENGIKPCPEQCGDKRRAAVAKARGGK